MKGSKLLFGTEEHVSEKGCSQETIHLMKNHSAPVVLLRYEHLLKRAADKLLTSQLAPSTNF
jgi:hypothetical protein